MIMDLHQYTTLCTLVVIFYEGVATVSQSTTLTETFWRLKRGRCHLLPDDCPDYCITYPSIGCSTCTCRPGPVDGYWGSWSSWSTCSGTCGTGNKRTRKRLCDSPPPSLYGFRCDGSSSQQESCNNISCTADLDYTLYCLGCNDVAQTQHCDRLVKCTPHERCHTERFVTSFGETRYNLGCVDSTLCDSDVHVAGGHFVCAACCNNSLCNSNLCLAAGIPPKSARGPICTNCVDEMLTDSCNQIKSCGRDQVCMLKLNSSGLYSSDCKEKLLCDQEHKTLSQVLVGRKRESKTFISSDGKCQLKCCDQDLCNIGCN